MGLLGKALIYPIRFSKVPLLIPTPTLFFFPLFNTKGSEEDGVRDIYWMFMGLGVIGGVRLPQGSLEGHRRSSCSHEAVLEEEFGILSLLLTQSSHEFSKGVTLPERAHSLAPLSCAPFPGNQGYLIRVWKLNWK